MIPTQETTDGDGRLGESGRADAMVEAGEFDEADTEQVLITAVSGDLDQAQAGQAAAEVVAGMTALQEVDKVAEPQVSPDGTAYLVSVQLARDQDDVGSLQEVTRGRPGGLPGARRASVGGHQPRRWPSTSGLPTTCPRPRRSACRSRWS